MDGHYLEHVGHDGEECKEDALAASVWEGMYIEEIDAINELCAALRAVYAIAGEDPEVRKIVESALNEHSITHT